MKVIIQHLLGNVGQEEKFRQMRRRFDVLLCQAEDAKSEVENAELQPDRKRKRVVDKWLKNFEDLKAKVQRIEHVVQEGESSSHKPSRNEVINVIQEIDELTEQRQFFRELTLYDPSSLSLPLVISELKGHMFEEGLERIKSWLKNDKFSRMGVYGVGGVGKTTLLMHAHNHLLQYFKTLDQGEDVFISMRHVYWVTVSQECTVFKLQKKIATAMGLSCLLEDNDERRRAAKLYEALKNAKEIVLFLDDSWGHFPAEEVGLPIQEKGFKFILSSRNVEVLRRMECQQILKVEPLLKEEAWALFKEKLGGYEKLPLEVKVIAKEVTEECAGLPLGVKTMAKFMTEVCDIHTWRNILAELRNSRRGHKDMEVDVLQILKLSYDYLKDVTLQQCFLLCALFPEDHQISRHELIVFMLSMGLLDGMKKRQEQLDKGHAMLNKLVNVCLLEAVTDANQVCYVKMHDLVRDMAIQIARDDHHYLIEAGMGLREAEPEWNENVTKVSLMTNCISEIPSHMSPNCPNLSAFLLQDNPLNTIPDSFFQHLNGLQLLNLSYTNIKRLPNSVSGLQNLTALILKCCWKLNHIPEVAALNRLRELDLSYCSAMRTLPLGMEGLFNLKCLNLKGSNHLLCTMRGVLSKIPTIQCLKLDHNVEGILGEELIELKHLERLEGWCTSDLGDFNRYVKSQHFNNLNHYEFVVGSGKFIRFLHELEEDMLHILEKNVRIYNSSININEVHILPWNIQYLQIQQCEFSDATLLDAILSLNESTRLMRIWIGRCKGLNSIFSATSPYFAEADDDLLWQAHDATPLQSLRELILWDLPEFEGLVREGSMLPSDMFANLTKLSIDCCPRIKSLLTLKHLQNLEEIKVQECLELEELIPHIDSINETSEEHNTAIEQDIDQGDTFVNLMNLRVLKLLYLPKLVSICSSGVLKCDKIEEIEISLCSRLLSLPLSLSSCNQEAPSLPCLREIKVEKEWWESLLWTSYNLKHVLQPFVRFQKLFDIDISF